MPDAIVWVELLTREFRRRPSYCLGKECWTISKTVILLIFMIPGQTFGLILEADDDDDDDDDYDENGC